MNSVDNTSNALQAANLRTFTVFPGDRGVFLRRLADFQKRGAKKGFAAPKLIYESAPRAVRQTNPAGDEVWYKVVDFVLSMPDTMRLAGWSLLATASRVVDEEGKDRVILKSVGNSDNETPADIRARLSAGTCDHCQTRRRRNMTYLVAHTDGRRAAVGSTCLTDFTGHDASALVAGLDAMLDFETDVGGDFEDGLAWVTGNARHAVPLVKFLAGVISLSESHGFVSGRQAYELGQTSTARFTFGAFMANKAVLPQPEVA